MSLLIKQLKCVFDGHESSFKDVQKLNDSQYIQGDEFEKFKELNTNCERCNYPIKLRKYERSPNKYKIIEM